jgi:hypothetical protein
LPLRISAPLLFYHFAMSWIAEPHSQRDFAQRVLRSGVTAKAFRRLSILIRAAQASSTCGCGIRH